MFAMVAMIKTCLRKIAKFLQDVKIMKFYCVAPTMANNNSGFYLALAVHIQDLSLQ